MTPTPVTLFKRFETPDEGREFPKGKFEILRIGEMTIGRATASMEGGDIVEIKPGDVFYVPPYPHDSWVVGDEPFASLHFLGADHYAKRN